MNTSITHIFTSDLLSNLSYNTPYFLFSKKKIRENLRAYEQLFPHVTVQYAMKANSEPEILETLATAGSGFEVASLYELNLLKKLSVSSEKIIYGTSVKPAEHIKEFVHYGVSRFAFDSLSELEKIAETAPRASVYVRVVANDTGSVFKFSEKFGTHVNNILPFLTRAKDLGLNPYGISFHVGSQASDSKAWSHMISLLEPEIKKLQGIGIILKMLNFGGGFPCQYASSVQIPSLDEIAKNTLQAYHSLPYHPQILIEPGRGIIGDTGIAVATVIARVERPGNTWLFLDLGVYNGLFETMAYQGSTRYPVTSLRPVGDSGEAMFALAGPTGDGPDVITREALLPSDISIGDKVVFHNVGAYSLVVTSPFNGFPKPDVYLVE